jgi:hypothetical protein
MNVVFQNYHGIPEVLNQQKLMALLYVEVMAAQMAVVQYAAFPCASPKV